MKKILLCIFFVSAVVTAKQFPHPLSVGGKSGSAAMADTMRVLAILVQFQTDEDDRTSGDGKFDLGNAVQPIIDAPPHDSAYFADHFIFARNYFRKASNDQLHVNATVLGGVITLSKKMPEYAPIGNNLPIVQLVEEAWKKADTLNPGFPFRNYDMFVVFHAGVGKDIDLRGALGYDPTPYDIPSLYFSLSGLKSVLGPSFTGIPVSNNSFSITNSVVLPETEVRRIPSIGDDVILKLSINGLLVASIGSHLGLPDLFDTKTGKTAIGRFGLMDGQSMFSYSGICPPEPSAWEKMYLGWTTPIEVLGVKMLNVPAVGLYDTGMDTVYRIPISAKEYYLVENRHRDAKQNGQAVTMKWNGNIITKVFQRDEDSFSNANIDSVYGVVLDVDELDWSIPGLINDNNNYRGGILVWHVDESIIEKNLATNSVNANAHKRGIDLEEADGSQDIGQSYDLLSAGSGSEDGSPLDYWFSGNIAPVYINEFSETTKPNSLSNLFAKSHITMKGFSPQSPEMTLEAAVGTVNIQLVKVVKGIHPKRNNNDQPITADLDNDGKEEIIYTSGDSIFVLKDDFTPYLNNAAGLFSPKGGSFQPAWYSTAIVGNPYPRGLIGVSDSIIYLFGPIDANSDGMADIYRSINVGDVITTPVFARDGMAMGEFIVGTGSGNVVVIDTAAHSVQFFSFPVIHVGPSAYASIDSLRIQGTSIRSGSSILSIAELNNEIIVLTNTAVIFYDKTTKTEVRQIRLRGIPSGLLAIHDVNHDQQGDIVVGIANALYAFNANGSVIDNFPFILPSKDTISGSIAASGDHIIFGTRSGLLYAITGRGKTVDGFPVQCGEMMSAPFISDKFIISASVDSSLLIRKHNSIFGQSGNSWRTYLGNVSHNNALLFTGPFVSRSNEILPKSLAYNWPNPVYSGTTNIRYFLGKDASVKISIINMAGELVEEIKGTSYVGLDNEVQWDVTSVQSGIYYAQITASGGSGVQSQIIKIAVVK